MATRRKPAEQYHHGNLRAALLAAAWTYLSRHGAEALSLRALAEALGVSHAAPAWHFKDKAALLEALRLEAWTRFGDALEAGAAEPDRLRGTGRAYLAFALRHPRQLELMFRAGAGPHPPAEEAQSLRAWAALTAAVAQAIGPRRAAEPGELASMAMSAWATTHGLSALLTEVVLPVALDDAARGALIERVLDVAVRGITHAPRPPAPPAPAPRKRTRSHR